jgi:osmotically inducible protein OsmC
MARVERTADVQWEGNLFQGNGSVIFRTGAAGPLPITWASRTERAEGRTSPEELLAAAQAGCYAMALSNVLATRGTPPDRLEVSATCAFEKVGDGFKVTTMDIRVRGFVPGIDEAAFQEAARTAEQGCPISNAIRGNVEIRLEASLETRLDE